MTPRVHFASSLREHFANTSREGFGVADFTSRISLREFTFSLRLREVCELNVFHFADFTSRIFACLSVRTPEDSHTGESFAHSLPVCGDPYPAPPLMVADKTLQGGGATRHPAAVPIHVCSDHSVDKKADGTGGKVSSDNFVGV